MAHIRAFISWMEFKHYMVAIAFLTNSYLFMQAYKIFADEQAQGISVPAFFLLLSCLVAWAMWGHQQKDKILTFSSYLGIAGSITVIIGALLYG